MKAKNMNFMRKETMTGFILITLIFNLIFTFGALAQTDCNAKYRVDAYNNAICRSDGWLDTGIDVKADDRITISASGKACIDSTDDIYCSGPDGIEWMYNECQFGELTAKIGSGSLICAG